ncbi:MAG: thioredoxin domain-containing protein [Verrucomicrobiae bacterium]|nr:thioredoxin domain-containing protein [Verrucomicrobiae bacterium]
MSRTANRLLGAASPYLRQHAYNPVDWWPWCAEAVAKAREENKPIFLSVGYSTCHWCHVMADECFDDEQTARLLNSYFVCIKLDREERPDIDRVYMSFLQTVSGMGGWPMNVWLTPDLQPFYAVSYLPRASFQQLIQRIHHVWRSRCADVKVHAAEISRALQRQLGAQPQVLAADRPTDDDAIARALAYYRSHYDWEYGGMSGAPKFPQPCVLNFLLQCGGHKMALHQLRCMADGGIYDQLGGGFHRYSTDCQWRVPHFEKMLCDQGQLVCAYSEAWQLTRDAGYLAVARETADYVCNWLRSPTGAFCAAEDADTGGVEGGFYTWTRAELQEILGVQAEAFCQLHGDHILRGRIPEPQRKALLAARNRRPRPHRDEKIITAWNALMISALARMPVDGSLYLPGALSAAEYLLQRGGAARRTETVPGLLCDHANLGLALLDLYEATLQHRWLAESIAAAERVIEFFYDNVHGGFFESDGRDPLVLIRAKDVYDGAEPSGNAQATLLLLRLAPHVGNNRYRDCAEKTLEFLRGVLHESPQAAPQVLCAFDLARNEPVEITFVGGVVEPFLRVVRETFLPRRVIRHRAGERSGVEVCAGSACRLATGDPSELEHQLARGVSPR